MLAGDVPLMFLPVHVALAQVKGGRLVVLEGVGHQAPAEAPAAEAPADVAVRKAQDDGVDAARQLLDGAGE